MVFPLKFLQAYVQIYNKLLPMTTPICMSAISVKRAYVKNQISPSKFH